MAGGWMARFRIARFGAPIVMIWVVYNLLFPVGFLLLLPYFLFRMSRRGGYARHFLQRIGRYDVEDRARLGEGGRLWIHAVSVGELYVAFRFMEEYRARRPEARFILSTTTSTGHTLAAKRLDPADVLIYFPVDFIAVMHRVLELFRPRAIFLVEGEYWPNLIRMARRRGIPVAMINGRMSARSFGRYRRLRMFMRPLLREMSILCVQSETDRQRLLELGADPARLKDLGSAKYDLVPPDDGGEQKARALLSAAGMGARNLILLGGSTWAGEEEALLEVYRQLKLEQPELVLVLVPRHAERAPAILKLIEERGLRAVRRTALDLSRPLSRPPDVLLVDSTGELRNFYPCADVIFVGKSLTQKGGQNIIEPAVCGKPIVVGPHLENFPVIREDFCKAEALLQVQDTAELATAIRGLLADAPRRTELGRRAARVVQDQAGALKATVEQLLPLIPS